MPVELDHDSTELPNVASAPRDEGPASPKSPRIPTSHLVERTALLIVTVSVRTWDAPSGVQVNRAAADALRLHRRWDAVQARARTSPRDDRPLTAEEKMATAIFGKSASLGVRALLDEAGLPSKGARLTRGDLVLVDPATRERLRFDADASCVVIAVRREGDEREGVDERVVVELGSESPLEAGDMLEDVDAEELLGPVEMILDDGASEPILWLGPSARGRRATMRLRRALPTARQDAVGCARGEADPLTLRPLEGERIGPAQRRAMAARGCYALFNELVTYKCDDATGAARALEALQRGASPSDPWQDVTLDEPRAVASTADSSDLFAFFERSGNAPPSRATFERAVAYAEALGVALSRSRRTLSLAWIDDPRANSCGFVTADLGEERVFGPRKDYECPLPKAASHEAPRPDLRSMRGRGDLFVCAQNSLRPHRAGPSAGRPSARAIGDRVARAPSGAARRARLRARGAISRARHRAVERGARGAV